MDLVDHLDVNKNTTTTNTTTTTTTTTFNASQELVLDYPLILGYGTLDTSLALISCDITTLHLTRFMVKGVTAYLAIYYSI